MPTDIEIARSVTPLPITEVAKNAGVDVKHLIPYGFDKAKVDYSLLNEPTDHQAKLVLVTAINPTPAGEGKTTTTIGLADGLRRRGVKSAVALREPSVGPVFGVKGGDAGGGVRVGRLAGRAPRTPPRHGEKERQGHGGVTQPSLDVTIDDLALQVPVQDMPAVRIIGGAQIGADAGPL